MNTPSKVFDITQKGDMDIEGKGSFDADSNITLPFVQQNLASILPKIAQLAAQAQAQDQGSEESDSEEDLKEHLAALFANTDLSEDFVEKAKTIFVAAVNEKANEISANINEGYEAKYNAALAETVNELTGKIDDYLSYVVEEWINENKLQVERGIKVELAENFIFGLKKLFESNFIDVPNEKYDVLDELYTKIEDQTDTINKSVNENINLRKKLLESNAIAVFAQETQGMAQTQIEKLASLAEGIEFDNADQFRNKIVVLRESYFGNNSANQHSQVSQMPRYTPKMDILDTSTEPEVITEGTMDYYRKAISRHLKK